MIDSAGIRIAQGQPIACERIEGVNDNMSKSHYHDFYELYFLENGERNHIIQESLYTIHAGQVVIFAPYVMHHSYGEENVSFRRIICYFQPSEIESPELLETLKGSCGVYPQLSAKNQCQIHQILNSMLQEENDDSPFRAEMLHCLLNVLLVSLFRHSTSVPHNTDTPPTQTLIEQVIDYIHTNYYTDISLDSLARQFYISPYHLCREFKRCTNRTLSQYINVTRVMNAQRKIIETDKSITEISVLTGFANLTHFNRVFKQYTGMTPTQYRKLSKSASIPSP